MNSQIIKNQLPGRFETYCHLYAYIKGRIQTDTKEIRYSEHGINCVWEFTVDFIKARCFEEVLRFYPKIEKSDYGGPDWPWDRLNEFDAFEKKTHINHE